MTTPFHRSATRLAGLAVALLVAAAAGIGAAAAQSYPSKPIRLVVPYAAGGSIDVITRQYAAQLGPKLGGTVVVENRTGAAGNIGSDSVAKSAPDGYTLLIATNTMTQNPTFGPVPPFDLLTSFEPVNLLVSSPLIVAANDKTPYKTAREFIAFAKREPGKATISSGQLDVYVELLKARAGIDLLHIPYRGGGPAIMDTLGGQVDTVLAVFPALTAHFESQKLRPLLVTSGKRLGTLPDVPTLKELGVDYDSSFWYGIIAPANTPREIIDRLAGAAQEILAPASEFSGKLRAQGMEPEPKQPAAFREQMRSELAFWQQVAKDMPKLMTPTAPK